MKFSVTFCLLMMLIVFIGCGSAIENKAKLPGDADVNVQKSVNSTVDQGLTEATEKSMVQQEKSTEGGSMPLEMIAAQIPGEPVPTPVVLLREMGDSSYFVNGMEAVTDEIAQNKMGMAVAIAHEAGHCILLTSYHVISNTTRFHLSAWTGNDYISDEIDSTVISAGSLIWKDVNTDVALIAIDSPAPCPVANIAHKLPRIGEEIFTFEQPARGRGSFKRGTVSGYWVLAEFGGATIIANMNVVAGGSGSGVFNDNNQLIGLNIAKSVNAQGLTVIYPLLPILRILDEQKRIQLIN